MKNLYLLILLFIGVAASAQSPDKMSYQAVLRDANGEILKNQDVSIQFSLLQTSISGTSVYQEDHKLTTNSNGLVSVYMGTGTVSSGDFSTIDWAEGPYFLQSEIDPTGGINYTISSTTELVSVPYAVYANKAEFADSLTGGVNETDPVFDASVAKGITDADTASWNGKLDGYTETDPVFDASVAKGITTNNTTYWNNKLDSSSIQNFVDLTTTQTVAGAKTFSSDIMVNGIYVGRGGNALDKNTAIGVNALYKNTSGTGNTSNGYNALSSNTSGSHNTSVGHTSLTSNTTGNGNTAFGREALNRNTTGSSNTASGYRSLRNNTIGECNTASGKGSLYYNISGDSNTAIGFQVLHKNTTGENNVAIGNSALYNNTTGSYNTAIGNTALFNNTTGRRNTANGNTALFKNTIGGNNTASGHLSLHNNISGKGNTATGNEALRYNTTAINNTANGNNALKSTTTGGGNTATGYSSLRNNTTGSLNTSMGDNALRQNTTGENNTAIGYKSMYQNSIGSNNTTIGNQADFSSNRFNNSSAIGNLAIATNSNMIRIGNTSVTRIEGQVAWTNLSDGRIKENVQEAVPGLSFISELRPVTYTLNTKKQDEITMQLMTDSIKEERMLSDEEYLKSSSIVRTGFIAQEVEAAAKKVGFDFDGVSTPENETDLYGIRYAEFVVPLVKAVQEQQEMIVSQQELISNQKAIIEQQRIDFQNQLQVLVERIEALEK